MLRQLISIVIALALAIPGAAALLGRGDEPAETAGPAVYTGLNYDSADAWSIRRDAHAPADAFIIAPTVDYGWAKDMNLTLEPGVFKLWFDSATAAQANIYAQGCNVYAPYYRQATMRAYDQPDAVRDAALDLAYEDIAAAFRWYLSRRTEGRPIILAGFSQGADMVKRLIKNFFGDEDLRSCLVAAYAIGWAFTEEDLEECPWLKMAQGETDTGVVISYECEARGMSDTRVVKSGVKMLSINPLTWSTGSEYASADKSLGACFLGIGGRILSSARALTGAYIDPERGTLVCPDLDPWLYPSGFMFKPGEYHAYDFQLFYRDLQKNARVRLSTWFSTRPAEQPRTSWQYALLAVPAMMLLSIPPMARRRKKRLAMAGQG